MRLPQDFYDFLLLETRHTEIVPMQGHAITLGTKSDCFAHRVSFMKEQ